MYVGAGILPQITEAFHEGVLLVVAVQVHVRLDLIQYIFSPPYENLSTPCVSRLNLLSGSGL